MGKVSRTTYVLSLLVVFFLPPALFAGLGVQLHTVTTGSMRPAIQPGAVVLTRLVKAEDIKKGHVILYFDTQTDNPVSHRVIAVNHLGNQVSITTKGDANAKADPTILEPNSVPIATVIGVLPGVGFIVSALHSTPAKVGLGFLLAILIALSFFYERHRKALHQEHNEISDEEVAEIEPELPVESQVEVVENQVEVDEEDLQVEMEPISTDLIEEKEVLVEDESELSEEPQPIELSEPTEIFEEENAEEEVVLVEVQPVVQEEFWISEPTSSEIEISHQLNEVLLAQSDLDLELTRLEAQFHEEISPFVEVEKVQKKNKDDKKKDENKKKNKKKKEDKKKEIKEKKKSKKKEYEEARKGE